MKALFDEDAWNPYFLAYCESEGRTPTAQLALDRVRFPGGLMAGFMLWIQARWAEFRKAHGINPRADLAEADHEAFGKWLKARAAEIAGARA